MKLISWNIAHRKEAWHRLLDTDADVALLQEAAEPPPEVASKIIIDGEPWITSGSNTKRHWRAAVVGLNKNVHINWLSPASLELAENSDFAVSRRGTLAVADVVVPNNISFKVVSMYTLWETPHKSLNSRWIYADASVHRLISDLAGLIGKQRSHRIIAAGDLNILYGYGEGGSKYWAARYGTVFTRMEAMGLPFVGPQAPNGRRAYPWPSELPVESKNVPTYHATRMTQLKRSGNWILFSHQLTLPNR